MKLYAVLRKFKSNSDYFHISEHSGKEQYFSNIMDAKLPHRKGVPVELFDAAIRIFDMIGCYYPDDYPALLEKMKYNDNRADHKAENRIKADGKKF